MSITLVDEKTGYSFIDTAIRFKHLKQIDECDDEINQNMETLINQIITQSSINCCNIIANHSVAEAKAIFRKFKNPFPDISENDHLLDLQFKLLEFKNALKPFLYNLCENTRDIYELEVLIKNYLYLQ